MASQKTKINGTYFLSVQNLFVKKRRFNAESVKIFPPENSNFSIPRFLPFDKICGCRILMKVCFKRQKYCRLKTLRVCRPNSQIFVHAFTTVRQSCRLAARIFPSPSTDRLWTFRNKVRRFFGFRLRYNFLS